MTETDTFAQSSQTAEETPQNQSPLTSCPARNSCLYQERIWEQEVNRGREAEQALGSWGRAVFILKADLSVPHIVLSHSATQQRDKHFLYWLEIYLGRSFHLSLCWFHGEEASQRHGQCLRFGFASSRTWDEDSRAICIFGRWSSSTLRTRDREGNQQQKR